MDWGLRDKVAVITGAGGGIGREVARAFADMGTKVVVCDIDGKRAEETLSTMQGDHLLCLKDLAQIENCKALVQETIERFGRLDILVNTAAILKRVPIEDVDEATWDSILNVNLKSLFFLSKEACAVMKRTGGGKIINFSSQGGFTGGFSQAAVYNSTKGAILTLTKSFARTYAAEGICVNAIAPGMVDTEMMKLPSEELQPLLRLIPVGRLAAPGEMVGAVLFLASSWSSYITGATIDVNGGQLMR